jgi:hypothetical protein
MAKRLNSALKKIVLLLADKMVHYIKVVFKALFPEWGVRSLFLSSLLRCLPGLNLAYLQYILPENFSFHVWGNDLSFCNRIV